MKNSHSPENESINIRPFGIILFCLLTFLYAPHLTNEFMIDDNIFLFKSIRHHFITFSDFFTKPHGHHYIPLYYLINITLFDHLGKNVFIFRLINFFLLYGNALVFFFLVRKLTRHDKIAILAALFFSCHCYLTNIINPVSSNFILVYGLFLQSSFLCFCYASDNTLKKSTLILCSVIFYIVSLLAYDNALLFPLVIFSYLSLVKKWSWQNSIIRCIPHLMIAVGYLAIWLVYIKSSTQFFDYFSNLNLTIYSYLANLVKMISWYISNLFIPHSFVYLLNIQPIEKTIWLWNTFGILALSGIIYLICFRWKRSIKSFAIVWFLIDFIILLPASLGHTDFGIVIVPHWFYFSSLGFFTLISILCFNLKSSKYIKVWYILISFVLIFNIIKTKAALTTGKSEKSYAEYWLTVCPNNMMALRTLGDYYTYQAHKKDYEKAVHYYQQILDQTSYAPDLVYDWIGNAYWLKKDFERAKRSYEQSLSIKPSVTTYNNLGEVYMAMHQHKQANAIFMQAHALDPNDPRTLSNLSSRP